MNNRKCIFFDADGTILDIEKGIPADIPSAIQTLTSQGHLAFLCTGRSRSFIPKEVEQISFTGMITNLGAYMEYQKKPIYQKEITTDEARYALNILRKNRLVPVMEGNSHMYYDLDEYTDEIDWFASLITKELGEKWRPITGNEDRLHINKISAKRLPGCNAEQACKDLKEIFDYIHHDEGLAGKTIEFIAKGHSKGLAIAILCGVLGVEKEDTFAFGDSNNDLPMFQAVHTKIAMGNAPQKLLEEADYVTKTMDKGGITQALLHYKLI